MATAASPRRSLTRRGSQRSNITLSRSSTTGSARASSSVTEPAAPWRVLPGRDRPWSMDDLARGHWSKPAAYYDDAVAACALAALNGCCGGCEKRIAGASFSLGRWALAAWQPRWLYATPGGLSYCRPSDPARQRHLPFEDFTDVSVLEDQLVLGCGALTYHFQPLPPLGAGATDAAGTCLNWASALRTLLAIANAGKQPGSREASSRSSAQLAQLAASAMAAVHEENRGHRSVGHGKGPPPVARRSSPPPGM